MDPVTLAAANATAAKKYPQAGPQLVGLSGHSYSQGVGADSDASGYAERYAKALGAQRWDKRGIGGAILCWASTSGQGDGGWAYALNGIRQGSLIEAAHPYAGASAAVGDYGPRATIEVPGWGINDLAELGSNNLRPFLEALRSAMSFMVAGRIIRADNPAFIATTGTWSTSTGEVGGAQGYGGAIQKTSTVGSSLTYTVGSDAPAGRTHGLHFVVKPTDNYVVTITRGGTQLVQKTVSGAAITDPNHTGVTSPANVYPIRLGMPGDGITISAGDQLVVTLTSLTAGTLALTAITVEADPLDGPILHIPLPNVPATFTTWASSPFGPNAGTNPMNAASVAAMKAAILAGPAVEFGARVVTSDFDSVLNASTDFASDGAHPNNKGHGRIAQQMISDLRASRLLTPRLAARASGPFVPFWQPLGQHHIANMIGPGAGVSFLNSWTIVDVNGLTAGTYKMPLYPGYRRDENGHVHHRGRITGGTSGTVAFNLVQGYWPANDRYFPLAAQDSGGVIVPAQAKVATNGQVTIYYTGTPAWVALDAINFQAEM